MLLGPKKGRKKVYSLSIKNNTLRLIPISQVLVNSKFLKFMNMDSTYLYLTSLYTIYNQYTCIIYHVQYSLAKVQYRGTTTSSWFTVISHLLFITGIIVNPILHLLYLFLRTVLQMLHSLTVIVNFCRLSKHLLLSINPVLHMFASVCQKCHLFHCSLSFLYAICRPILPATVHSANIFLHFYILGKHKLIVNK